MTGVELIAAERQRQVTEEGWDATHDDRHTGGELAAAAACYAGRGTIGWPWDFDAWKPSDDAVRNLAKAGALIAAEIDRLQRKRERTKV